MLKLILSFLLVSASLSGYTQEVSPSMTVFGFKMGDKFTLPECEGKEVMVATREGKGIFARKRKSYQYIMGTPVKGGCFIRNGYNGPVKSNDEDPHPPFIGGPITVRYAVADAPQLCPTGSFNATIDNNRLVSVNFDILSANADNVLATLRKKYGNSGVVKNEAIQNGYGATLNYYTVVWAFKDLWVILRSSQARSLSEQFGSVTIQLPVKSNVPEDKNKL